MASKSFLSMATVIASIKRSPAPVDGNRGARAEVIASIKCTPLDPVDAELRERLSLDTPYELLQTYFETDELIVEGDIVAIAATSREYPIRSLAEWERGLTTYRAILEDLKK